MLNTYHVHPTETRNVHTSVSIQEHRAPTDKSIEILNEMQREAIKNIVSRFDAKDNTLNLSGAVMHNPANRDKVALIKIKLNGHDHQVQIPIDSLWIESESDEVIYVALCEFMASVVLSNLRGALRK